MAHAAALADQASDPQPAALIALAALTRSPYYLRHANLRGLASDGAILVGPYGGVLAVPPELRRFLSTWHHQRARQAADRELPLFAGNSHGRISQPAIRRRVARLDAPASLWEDPPDTTNRYRRLALDAWRSGAINNAELAEVFEVPVKTLTKLFGAPSASPRRVAKKPLEDPDWL